MGDRRFGGFGRGVVGGDDLLDKGVADDIGALEGDGGDAWDVLDAGDGVDEAGLSGVWEVDLGGIACDDHFAGGA